MRHFVSDPGGPITESLQGMALYHADLLRVHLDPDYVVRRKLGPPGKVAIVTGSGSGHEPLPVGYVGQGMLDAACPGPVFTSPTPDQLLAATRAAEQGGGVAFVVKNYAGATLNSDLAVEMAAAEGIQARRIIVNDDVAIHAEENRRGLGGSIVAIRMAGAAAEEGRSLDEVVAVAQRAVRQSRSMGVATDVDPEPGSDIRPNGGPRMVELGVGIHGEPGIPHRINDGAEEVVERLMQPIVDDLPFRAGDRTLLIVSGLGGAPALELYLFYHHIHRYLQKRGIHVVESLVGNYLTCLGRDGCTVTLTRLDEELHALWRAPVHTPTLRWP